jgi:hypothetical protein
MPVKKSPAVPAAPKPLNPERLTPRQVEDIVFGRITEAQIPKAARNLTCERQLKFLAQAQTQVLNEIAKKPRLEDMSIPRRNPDGTLARDSNGIFLFDTIKVPAGQDRLDEIERLAEQVRAFYRAFLAIGPRARQGKADAERRFLERKFGPVGERVNVRQKDIEAALADFRANGDPDDIAADDSEAAE